MIPELREYQEESVSLIEDKFKKSIKIILLVLVGGAGKTTIASFMIHKAKQKGTPVLFIAHRKELIKQCHKRLLDFGIDSGIIMSGEPENMLKTVQVASIQTLQNRMLPPAKLIIVDEAHRSIGPQYLKILRKYEEQGAFIIGLTGTPFRTNKRESLDVFYQDFVSNISCSMLIEKEYIVPVKVYASGKISSKGMKTRGGDFREDELMKAFDTENVYINLISNYEKHKQGNKTIVFCCSVQHSIRTTEEFLNRGYKALHVDGNTPPEERDEIIRKFREGEIDILCNYGILAEGFDVPDTNNIILNLATKSRIKYLQACWRGSRPNKATGKTNYIVIDMADNCERFGFPDEDIEVSLEAEDKTESNGVAPVKLCPCCSYMNHASVKSCADCSTEFTKTKKEIQEEEFIELQRNKKERKWKNYTKKDWYKIKDEELEEFGRFKGYKPQWAKMQIQERKAGRKPVKIIDHSFTRQEYFKKTKELENAYFGKKAINATEFVFIEENKAFVVFKSVQKEIVENE
jgi:DNA repair protein RadD